MEAYIKPLHNQFHCLEQGSISFQSQSKDTAFLSWEYQDSGKKSDLGANDVALLH